MMNRECQVLSASPGSTLQYCYLYCVLRENKSFLEMLLAINCSCCYSTGQSMTLSYFRIRCYSPSLDFRVLVTKSLLF